MADWFDKGRLHMTHLNEFPITRLFPPNDPDVIQLYSFATPNGVKISIALEEMGLEYEAHLIDISKDDQKTEDYLALNPNGKIPSIVDPNGPEDKPIGLFESGAILVYLADKTDLLMPDDMHRRYECLQWVFFQIGGIGPMFGQFGHFFKFAKDKITDLYPTERYTDETRRLLAVLENRLSQGSYLMGDEYTIADIATFPWVRAARDFYGGGDALGLDDFSNVTNWLATCLARPASQKGLKIPSRPSA